MLIPKLAVPLTLACSLIGGALTAGMAVGKSNDKIEAHAADIHELQEHDRENNGDIHELKSDVKDLVRGMERLERHFGTK